MDQQFKDCRKVGHLGENLVARYLENLGFVVRPNGYQKAEGAEYTAPDLLIEKHISGTPSALAGKTIEVKSEKRSHQTGNVSIEVFSNLASGRRGWVYDCTADFLAHLSLGDGLLLLVPFQSVRDRLKNIWHKSPLRPTSNVGYTGVMLLVPRDQLQEEAIHVGRIQIPKSTVEDCVREL